MRVCVCAFRFWLYELIRVMFGGVGGKGSTYIAEGAMVRIKDKQYSSSTIKYDFVFDKFASFKTVIEAVQIPLSVSTTGMKVLIDGGGGVGDVVGYMCDIGTTATMTTKQEKLLTVLRDWPRFMYHILCCLC